MPCTVGMNAPLTRAAQRSGVRSGHDHRPPLCGRCGGNVDAEADADVLLKAAIERAAALVGNRKPDLPVIKRSLPAEALAGLAVPTTVRNLAFAVG